MAKVFKDGDGMTHLQGDDASTLCGIYATAKDFTDGTLTCPDCATIALKAIETSTKAERREWRKL